ncbi:MAG TPA: helix-turn-helix domain-containing protein [Thermoleophilaceae bacterium]|nr:helix-turn-helix domain-containing protein [Thermoleophilaceae bacterium]
MAVSPPRRPPSLRTATAPSTGRRRRPDQLVGGRHGLTAAEVEASQRERIVRAMTAAVGEHGYHGTRVSDVVWRAGVSRKTFYELFGGKDDCFAATYAHWLDWLLDTSLDAFETQEQWVDRLRAALTALLGALAREPDVARLCFAEAMAAGEQAARRRDDWMTAFAAVFDFPGAPRGALGEALRTGRVGELSELLRREVAAGRARRLPELGPELMYSMVLPFLGADAAQHELDRARGRR